MKKNVLFEDLMQNIPSEIQREVDLSFEIVDRIYEILEEKKMTQRDFARLMGKNETEICKWMRGTHNFTLQTIARIESALNEKILRVESNKKEELKTICVGMQVSNLDISTSGCNKMRLSSKWLYPKEQAYINYGSN